MFTESRRVLKFAMASVLLAVDLVPVLEQPASAAIARSSVVTIKGPTTTTVPSTAPPTTTTKPSTTTTVPLRAVVLRLFATAPLIASPSGPYQGPWGRYLNVRPQGEVGGGSWDSEGDFDVLCGGTTPPVIIDNGAADPLDRPVCVARGFGVQSVLVRDRLGRFAPRNQQWIASKPIRLRAIAGHPSTTKGQIVSVEPAPFQATSYWCRRRDSKLFSIGPTLTKALSALGP
jgi:hypothetical protein